AQRPRPLPGGADAAVDPLERGRSRVRPRPGAGGGRGAVPAGLGRPVAGRRRRPSQARRRRRAAGAGSRGAAETTTENRSAIMTALELRGVSKTYGEGAAVVQALSGVSLSVEPGAMVAVMGPSGSGKSPLLTIAGSLEEPTSGEVLIDGTPLSRMSRNGKARLRRRSIGYVFQDFNLLPGLTAAENVALPLELDGMSSRRARATGKRTLDDL